MSEITSKDVQLYLSNIYGTKEFLKKQKFLEVISSSQASSAAWFQHDPLTQSSKKSSSLNCFLINVVISIFWISSTARRFWRCVRFFSVRITKPLISSQTLLKLDSFLSRFSILKHRFISSAPLKVDL